MEDNNLFPLLKPKITQVEITPNPAVQNTQVLIKVTVEEVVVYVEPQILYSDTFYSGEEWA